jgi:hypothetical protein
MMISFPNVVKQVAVFTAVSPVTQTALVDVKNASVNEMDDTVDWGIIKSNAPDNMKNPKLAINNCAGLKYRMIQSSFSREISRMKKKKAKKWKIEKL